MRRNIITCAVIMASMILIPLASMQSEARKTENTSDIPEQYDGYISVMKSENGKVENLGESEYLKGVLAAEMSMEYHEEALKAQVVAAYTYALYQRQYADTDELNGADISDDPLVHQGYLNAEERQEKWGEKFEEYEKKAQRIVESVKGVRILYNSEPILAAYHDLNNGRTYSAQTVWKKDIPYLQQAESPGDKLSDSYSEEIKLTYAQFKEKIEKIDGVHPQGEEEKWIGEVMETDEGYVTGVEVCSNTVASSDFRTALGLRSCCFEIESNKDGIVIRTFGNGHMVGMSQYGADYMARQGSGYREILMHYYENIEIK